MRSYIFGVIVVAAVAVFAVCEYSQVEPEPEPIAVDTELVSGAVSEGDACQWDTTTVLCHSPGPVEVEGRGEFCVLGERRCVDGQWSACEDIQYVQLDRSPTGDGVLREPLIGDPTTCGGCDPDCFVTRDSPSCDESDCFDGIDNDGDGRIDDDFGDSRFGLESLVYDATAGGLVIPAGGDGSWLGRYAWISSHEANVVNKLNMETLTNDGVYRTGQESIGDSNPSRTTVDRAGFVYVANRDHASVTKIAGDLENCRDLDGDGIETSAGELAPLDDGTPQFDLLGSYGEADQDECIIWDRTVGGGSGGPRAVAIDARARLWVGLRDDSEYWVLDTETGATLVDEPIHVDHKPYGAAISPDGTLWSAATEGYIQSISTLTDNPSDSDVGELITAASGVYGIAVDQYDRVFVGGGKSVGRYDPDEVDPDTGEVGTWATGSTQKAFGVSVHIDGFLYVAGGPDDVITEHNFETLDVIRSWAVFEAPRGCAPDFMGRVWAANHGSPDCAVIDLTTSDITYINTYGNNYTYSDFTGYGFATFSAPEGQFTRLFDSQHACGSGDLSERYTLYYDADMPDTTSIIFYAKTAETTPGLTAAREVLLGEVTAAHDPGYFDLQEAFGNEGLDPSLQYMLIRVSLQRNDSSSSPVFRNLALEEYCI